MPTHHLPLRGGEKTPLVRIRAAACLLALVTLALPERAQAQSADWQKVIWRDPQVRYLLADVSLGGNLQMYRNYATRESDPDSKEAVRLWDAGVRVLNTNQFERKWLSNKYGKEGRVMRVVHRGTERTIAGDEVILSSDGRLPQSQVRLALLALSLGTTPERVRSLGKKAGFTKPAMEEAFRYWNGGCRALNAGSFQMAAEPIPGGALRESLGLQFRGSRLPADGMLVRLTSDLAYPETNVRYFMADIALGGSIEFYRAAAERDHEMGCMEAVRRTEEGYKIANLSELERKRVDGKVLITRRGSNERISGGEVKLSSDGE